MKELELVSQKKASRFNLEYHINYYTQYLQTVSIINWHLVIVLGGCGYYTGSYVCVSVRVSKSILLLGIRYGDGFSKIKLVTTTVHLVCASFFRLIPWTNQSCNH